MGILLKGGAIVLEDRMLTGDLRIEKDLIKEVGESLTPLPGEEVLDVTGKIVMPGIIDAHVHYKMPIEKVYTIDNFETGSRAALCGGVTTVVDYAEPRKGLTLPQALDYRVKEAIGHNFTDFTVHMTLSGDTPYNLDDLKAFRAYGVNSLKLYTTYGFIMGYEEIGRVLSLAKEAGLEVTIHAEDNQIVAEATKELKAQGRTGYQYHGESRPSQAEIYAVERIIELCEELDVSAHIVHVSSGFTGDVIARAKARGVKITAETCPHYLMLNKEVYQRPDGQLFIMQPPLRGEEERQLLWKHLYQGTFDFVTTDHCAYSPHQKFYGSAFYETNGGIPGTETLLPVLFSETVGKGKMTPVELARILSLNPARKFGLYPKKGALLPGSYGDIVVVDPLKEVELTDKIVHTAADYTPFNGTLLKGYPVLTILRGKVAYQDGKFLLGDPEGKFISCN